MDDKAAPSLTLYPFSAATWLPTQLHSKTSSSSSPHLAFKKCGGVTSHLASSPTRVESTPLFPDFLPSLSRLQPESHGELQNVAAEDKEEPVASRH